MLHILLTILKVLLFAILIILGIILFILLVVLLAPVHYRADIKYKDKAKVFAKIRYLIVSVRVSFDQETKELKNEIRICGLKLKGKKKHTEEQPDPEAELEKHGKSYDEFGEAGEELDKEDDDLPGTDIPEAKELMSQEEQVLTAKAPEHIESDAALKEQSEADSQEKAGGFTVEYGEPEELTVSIDSSELIETPPDIEDTVREEKTGFIAKVIARLMDIAGRIVSKVAGLLEKLFDKVDEVSDKVDAKIDDTDAKLVRADKAIRRFEKFWELECTEKTKAYLVRYLKSVLRHIAPRSAKGYAEYGFDDAAKTGEVTGILSLLPCMYQKKLYLYPNFRDKVMDIDVSLKGYIVLGYIIRIIFNINLWKTLLAARKLKAPQAQGGEDGKQ